MDTNTWEENIVAVGRFIEWERELLRLRCFMRENDRLFNSRSTKPILVFYEEDIISHWIKNN